MPKRISIPRDLPPGAQDFVRDVIAALEGEEVRQSIRDIQFGSVERTTAVAQGVATEAKSVAVVADEKAGLAQETAVAADEKAEEAKTAASTAIEDATQAAIDAQKAIDDAGAALTEVEKSLRTSLDQYVVTDSSTVAPGPDADWSDDTPDWVAGQYVWRRQKNTAINGDVTYSAPAVITGADGTAGEDAVLLRVMSTKGTTFKNDAISTDLYVVVFKGALQITNITQLRAEFGLAAYLEWQWRREDDDSFGVISSSDARLSQGGFVLTVSPADVDEYTTFRCTLNT